MLPVDWGQGKSWWVAGWVGVWQESVPDGARYASDELSVLLVHWVKSCRWRRMERWVDEWQGGPLDGSTCEQGDLVVCCV